MGDTKYKRILLKISGEALAGDAKIGINDEFGQSGPAEDLLKL